jgi:hypothetical protein
MSTDRDRGSYGLLSRYEWGFCALLATVMIVGVGLEISRLAGKARKTELPQASKSEVGAVHAAIETPQAESVSVR